ncbi:GINS complex, Sld5 component [Polyplosphaeria fusca]|uniref:DNA replication complex GINS protein SLD5 n=1 Tax=Polyplosphaeria fusca TaxID=682080 RepID=A0A9P4R0T6_9PLEO|nr:GINS complex, Sld5 component [Polyplosphaeria fusca]
MDIDDILAEVDAQSIPQETKDLQELTRAWIAERVAPELLKWPSALMDRVLERIRQQIESVEEQTGNLDPKANFTLIIIQTELERFKFLIRSFLRARLSKIDAHAAHYAARATSTPSLLSSSETQYLRSHTALLSAHYAASFLGTFPASLRGLEDSTGGVRMVDGPDEDGAVFVRALRDVGSVGVEGTERRFEVRRGDVWVVRWSAVRGWVEMGDMEVI